jgi:hypothetical protein
VRGHGQTRNAWYYILFEIRDQGGETSYDHHLDPTSPQGEQQIQRQLSFIVLDHARPTGHSLARLCGLVHDRMPGVQPKPRRCSTTQEFPWEVFVPSGTGQDDGSSFQGPGRAVLYAGFCEWVSCNNHGMHQLVEKQMPEKIFVPNANLFSFDLTLCKGIRTDSSFCGPHLPRCCSRSRLLLMLPSRDRVAPWHSQALAYSREGTQRAHTPARQSSGKPFARGRGLRPSRCGELVCQQKVTGERERCCCNTGATTVCCDTKLRDELLRKRGAAAAGVGHQEPRSTVSAGMRQHEWNILQGEEPAY